MSTPQVLSVFQRGLGTMPFTLTALTDGCSEDRTYDEQPQSPDSAGEPASAPLWNEGLAQHNLKVVPNPAVEKAAIFYRLPEGQGTALLSVSSAYGQELLSQQVSNLNDRLDLDCSGL